MSWQDWPGATCLHVGDLQGRVVGPQLQRHRQPRRNFHCRHSTQVLQVHAMPPHINGQMGACRTWLKHWLQGPSTTASQLTCVVHQLGVVGVGCDQRHERLLGQPELSKRKECLPRLCVILAQEALDILQAGCTAREPLSCQIFSLERHFPVVWPQNMCHSRAADSACRIVPLASVRSAAAC